MVSLGWHAWLNREAMGKRPAFKDRPMEKLKKSITLQVKLMETNQFAFHIDCNLGVPGLHSLFSAKDHTTPLSPLVSFANSLNSEDGVAVKRGVSARIHSPLCRSRRANAPHPEIGDGVMAKKVLLKRLDESSRGLNVRWCGRWGRRMSVGLRVRGPLLVRQRTDLR